MRTSNNTNELIAIEHSNYQYAGTTKIEWFLGMKCNLSCTYCAEYDSQTEFASYEKIVAGIDRLHDQISHRKPLILLGGGEPSLHPDIHKICKHIAQKPIYLSMISNGTLHPSLYCDMLDSICHYTFSIHFETNSYKKTMTTIIAVANDLKDNDRAITENLQVNVMISPGSLEKSEEVISLLQELAIPYVIRRVRPRYEQANHPIPTKQTQNRLIDSRNQSSDHGYFNKTELSFLQKNLFSTAKNTREYWMKPNKEIVTIECNVNDTLTRKINHFKNWTCWAGIERLHIYPDGDIFRSTCQVGGKLGNIYEDFILPQNPIICTNSTCTCAWAVNLSKVKSPEFTHLLKLL